MNRSANFGRLSDGEWSRLQDLLDAFEGAWQLGEAPELAIFAPPLGDPLREVALPELVKSDLEIRWRHHQPVLLEEYLSQFPELGTPQTRREVGVERIRAALNEAGANATEVQFSGSTQCDVEVQFDNRSPGDVVNVSPSTQPAIAVAVGDFITASMKVNGRETNTVLRAIEPASAASTIRAKNEATGAVYFVQLTGPCDGICLPYLAE